MPQVAQFKVSIPFDRKALEEYAIEFSEENAASCYVPSELGQVSTQAAVWDICFLRLMISSRRRASSFVSKMIITKRLLSA